MAEQVNPQLVQIQAQAQKDAAYQAYLDKVFELKDLPLSQAQIKQTAWESAIQAASTAGYMPTMNADNTWSIGATPTLARDQLNAQTGLSAAQLVAGLRGPRDAFAQQAAINGLNEAGLSNAVDYVTGRVNLPSFQVPQAQAEPASFSTLAEQMKTNAIAPVATTPTSPATPAGFTAPGVPAGPAQVIGAPAQATPALAGFTAPGGSQTPNASAAAYGAALGPTNKLIPRNWLKLGQDSQQFLLGAAEATGRSANDVNDQLKRLLPQFRAPSSGVVY